MSIAPLMANALTKARRSKSGKVRAEKISEVVAKRLRDRILSGELVEGATLDGGEKLLKEFGVSKPTMREAFRILETEGLITTKRGRDGAIIHAPGMEVAARCTSFVLQARRIPLDDVYSTRVLIEPAAVRLLAEKRSKASISALRRQLQAVEAALDDDDQFAHESAVFYRELVELAGISTLSLLMEMINAILEQYLAAVVVRAGREIDNTRSKQAGVTSKQKLLGYIEAGQANRAEEYWREYLLISQRVLLKWQPQEKLLTSELEGQLRA